MLPYILAAVGGYLIGDSLKGKQYADGGMMARGYSKGGFIELELNTNIDAFDKHYNEIGFTKKELSEPYQKDGKYFVKTKDESIVEQLVEDGFVKKYADGGMMAKGGLLEVGDMKGKQYAEGGMVFKKGDMLILKDGGGRRSAIVVKDGVDEKNRVRVRPDGFPMDMSVPMSEQYSSDKRVYVLHKMAKGGNVAGEIEVGDKVKYKNSKYHATVIDVIDDAEIPYAKIEYADGKMEKAYLEDLQKVTLGIAPEYVNPKYK